MGQSPYTHELFLHTHTWNHDGVTFVSDRARQIHVR